MSYTIRFSAQAKEDIRQHKRAGNTAGVAKITVLAAEIAQHPFSGTGKPEPLKHSFSGLWSRRISREHRLIYEVLADTVVIHSAKGHYE